MIKSGKLFIGCHAYQYDSITNTRGIVNNMERLMEDIPVINSFQIFGNMSKEKKRLKKLIKKYKLNVFVHGDYRRDNAFLSQSPSDKFKGSVKTIKKELELVSEIGAKGLVIHLNREFPLKIVEKLESIATYIPKDVKIYLENGSQKPDPELSYEKPEQLNRLCEFINNSSILKNKIKLCIDTSHLWVGYIDVVTSEGVKKWLKALKYPEMIGLIHLNSNEQEVVKKDGDIILKPRKDKHKHIYLGFWYSETENYKNLGLSEFVKFAYKNRIPIILERHGMTVHKEIDIIKSIVGL
jgi:endonuclease IV